MQMLIVIYYYRLTNRPFDLCGLTCHHCHPPKKVQQTVEIQLNNRDKLIPPTQDTTFIKFYTYPGGTHQREGYKTNFKPQTQFVCQEILETSVFTRLHAYNEGVIKGYLFYGKHYVYGQQHDTQRN